MAGIYIHIPFCRHICNYCDFHHSASLLRTDEMVSCLVEEIKRRANFLAPDAKVDTIYFGGGTPSVLSPNQIGLLLDTCRQIWGADAGSKETTLEANPEDLTSDYLSALQAIGINRLSIGIQSFDDEHLRLMNRRHSGGQAIEAVRSAVAAGFHNITIDLIYGLPFMTNNQWQNNLDKALELGVDHISAYHLTIEPHTVFGKQGLKGVDDSVSETHFRMLRKTLLGAGYEHYEVSNFAQPARRSIHNSNYWSGVPYLGVGPSAHSFNGADTRSWNPSSNKQYMEGAALQHETLTPRDHHNEMVMTRLRTSDGISLDSLPEDSLLLQEIMHTAEKWIKQGKMVINTTHTGRHLSILPQYFLISDSIIADFFE